MIYLCSDHQLLLIPHLYYINNKDADDIDCLRETGITYVLNVTSEWHARKELTNGV